MLLGSGYTVPIMSRQAAAKPIGFGVRSLKPIQSSSSSSSSRHFTASSPPPSAVFFDKSTREQPIDMALSSGTLHDTESSSESMEERFERWMAKYGRVYKDDAEKQMRLKVFKATAEFVDNFNKNGDQPFTVGTNKFADWTEEERNKLCGHRGRAGERSP